MTRTILFTRTNTGVGMTTLAVALAAALTHRGPALMFHVERP